MSGSRGLELLNAIKKRLLNSKGFERVVNQIVFVSGDDGNCIAEMKVGSEHVNEGGTLHGGMIATLIDCVSSYALLTKGEYPRVGVSVNMNIRYLKGAKVGDDIIINASTVKAGKTMAFLEVEIKDKLKGHILAQGSHTKFIATS